MINLVHRTEHYLGEALGIRAESHPWPNGVQFPQYLRDRYRFVQIDLLRTRCLLLVDADESEETPAVVAKHLDQVRARHDLEVVYVRDAVTSYNRRRLIEQKVPFIVPGNQMYLPFLGIDLREHLKRLRERKLVFSPSTHVLILHVLRHHSETLTPAGIAQSLGYTPMTMTRAFDELETADIGEHSISGKERRLRFVESGQLLWEKALPYLTTPVRKRIYLSAWHRHRDDLLAGESALAQYTMLAEPKVSVFAVRTDEWKARIKRDGILELSRPEPGAYELELWKYSPASLARQGKVDRLSLYLSLKDTRDERVQSALDELLRGMDW